MDKDTFLTEIVEKYLPDDTDLIGPTGVRAIVKGNTNFQKPQRSLNIDLTVSIQLVVALVAFINNVLGIYDRWRRHQMTGLSINELKEKLSVDSKLPTELNSRVDELLEEIIRYKELDHQKKKDTG